MFSKKAELTKTIELKAFVTGNVMKIEDIPDPVFAEKMMGDGIAIVPAEGSIFSPVNGDIMHVFPTKHAISIKTANGAELLIHIGLETVSMNGEGFTVHVTEGKTVKVGDALITVDLDMVKKRAKSTVIPIIITNTSDMLNIDKPILSGKVTAANDTILAITAK